jgi:hypothetical protein
MRQHDSLRDRQRAALVRRLRFQATGERAPVSKGCFIEPAKPDVLTASHRPINDTAGQSWRNCHCGIVAPGEAVRRTLNCHNGQSICLQSSKQKIGIITCMTFKPTDNLILDLTVTCPVRGYQIQPTEVVLVGPQTLRCPKCQQVFSPPHRSVA